MREKLKFIIGRIKAGRLQEMWKQTLWIYQYGKKYWLVMLFYTLLGTGGTAIALRTRLRPPQLPETPTQISGNQTGEQ